MAKAARIRASQLQGSISIPPSKSQTMRALIFATLAKGKSRIHHYLHSPDTEAMIKACRLLGAQIEVLGPTLEIEGNLRPAEDIIYAGNSGQVLRFIGAISALTSGYTILTGDHSIRRLRPIKPLLDGLQQWGAFAISSRGDGHAPIVIKGPIRGGTARIRGEDSQPVSGLLIAAAFALAKSELYVENPGEKPWVALTLNWFDRLGISYTQDRFEKYTLTGSSMIEGFEYHVPGDWSSASYPIAAALITGSLLTIQNVDFEDPQGDKELLVLLQEMGANLKIDPRRKTVSLLPGSSLKGQRIDVSRFIDAITLLPVIGCFAKGKTEIFGGKIARQKECNRIHAIVTELKKMGAKIEETEDGMIVEQSDLLGAPVESYSDHRMILSLTVAALGAKGETVISGIESVRKSFPDFFDSFRNIGACIE